MHAKFGRALPLKDFEGAICGNAVCYRTCLPASFDAICVCMPLALSRYTGFGVKVVINPYFLATFFATNL
ncbi:MAG: hypothetical protein QW717_04075 [Candidatus Bathyarchaeia archaeon]